MTQRFYFQNLLGNKEFTATLTHQAILQKSDTFRGSILESKKNIYLLFMRIRLFGSDKIVIL